MILLIHRKFPEWAGGDGGLFWCTLIQWLATGRLYNFFLRTACYDNG